MTQLTLSFLGAAKIQLNNSEVAIGRAKALALLAYLAVSQRSFARDSLTLFLWPDYDSKQALTYLRQTIWTINKAIGKEWLNVTTHSVELDFAADLSVDVIEYQRRLRIIDFESTGAARLPGMLQTAELYRGDFLEGFTLEDSPDFEHWQLLEAESLRQSHSTLLANIVQYLGEGQDYAKATTFAQRWLAMDRLNEAAHRQLMKLFSWSGQRGQAVRQFQECTHILNKELGVSPAEATVQLYESINQNRLPPPSGDIQPVAVLVPPARNGTTSPQPLIQPVFVEQAVIEIENGRASLTRPLAAKTANEPARPNLPIAMTPFIGRELELRQIADLLADRTCRLVSLVAVGGIGKTRLAVAAAESVQQRFAHGVFFVPLADLTTTDRLTTAIANVLEFTLYRREEKPLQQLLTYLGDKQMLLVLDNFEHLLEGTTLVSAILTHAPAVKILVTSRERLNLEGEWLVEVTGLNYPRYLFPNATSESLVLEFSAVELFVRSAQRVNAAFYLDKGNQSIIVKICQMVEGMPLALELAASWIRLLPCDEIAAEIQQGISILSTTQRNIPERHRSMVALFNYSWFLLSENERAVAQQLSVLRGGFRRDAAQVVAAASLPLLLALADKSLLRSDGAGRFSMHELLRQFASEKLAVDAQVKTATFNRHADHFIGVLKRHSNQLHGKAQKRILEEIVADIENIRDGWRWVVQHQNLAAIDSVVDTLATIYELCGWFHEGEAVFAEAVAQFQSYTAAFDQRDGDPTSNQITDHQITGKLMARLAFFSHRLGKYAQAKEQFQRSYQLLLRTNATPTNSAPTNSASEIIYCLNNLGDIARVEGDYDEAERCLVESIQRCQAEGIKLLQGRALNILGIVCGTRGRYDLAKEHFQASLQICEAIEDQLGIAKALNNLGILAYFAQDYGAATQFYRRSLTINQDLGHQYDAALALSNLGMAAHKQGDYGNAVQMLQEGCALLRRIGYELGVGLTLVPLSVVLLELGRVAEASTHYLEVLQLGEKIHSLPLSLAGLAGIATIYAHKNEWEEALTLATIVKTHPAADEETRSKATVILQQAQAHAVTFSAAILADKSLDETVIYLVATLLATGINRTLLSSFSRTLPSQFVTAFDRVK